MIYHSSSFYQLLDQSNDPKYISLVIDHIVNTVIFSPLITPVRIYGHQKYLCVAYIQDMVT